MQTAEAKASVEEASFDGIVCVTRVGHNSRGSGYGSLLSDKGRADTSRCARSKSSVDSHPSMLQFQSNAPAQRPTPPPKVHKIEIFRNPLEF